MLFFLPYWTGLHLQNNAMKWSKTALFFFFGSHRENLTYKRVKIIKNFYLLNCKYKNFNFKCFFAKVQEYNTNISSIIFFYDTDSYICEVLWRQAGVWSYSSQTPIKKSIPFYVRPGRILHVLSGALEIQEAVWSQQHIILC